jgi:CO dehydrogenase nickel-insertion accessory protein CooC1
MRISLFGKGGSGKTALEAAAKYFTNTYRTLAIDADVNVHLGAMLDLEQKPVSKLGQRCGSVKKAPGRCLQLRGRCCRLAAGP